MGNVLVMRKFREEGPLALDGEGAKSYRVHMRPRSPAVLRLDILSDHLQHSLLCCTS